MDREVVVVEEGVVVMSGVGVASCSRNLRTNERGPKTMAAMGWGRDRRRWRSEARKQMGDNSVFLVGNAYIRVFD